MTSNLPTARTFYESVLGLTPLRDRLALPFVDEWYALKGHQQLHLMPHSCAGTMAGAFAISH